MTQTLLNTPGLEKAGPAVWAQVAAICARNGWHADGLIALIEHESGWTPNAKNPNPGQTATGLIQFTAATAKSLGTTVEQIATMSAAEQLPLVEVYFRRWQSRNPLGPWDWMVFGLGAGNLPPGPLQDSGVLYAPGSAGSKANPGLADPDEAIRVGSVRRRLQMYAARFASRPRLVAAGGEPQPGAPFPVEGDPAPAGLVGVAAALAGLASALTQLREELAAELGDIDRELTALSALVRVELGTELDRA